MDGNPHPRRGQRKRPTESAARAGSQQAALAHLRRQLRGNRSTTAVLAVLQVPADALLEGCLHRHPVFLMPGSVERPGLHGEVSIQAGFGCRQVSTWMKRSRPSPATLSTASSSSAKSCRMHASRDASTAGATDRSSSSIRRTSSGGCMLCVGYQSDDGGDTGGWYRNGTFPNRDMAD